MRTPIARAGALALTTSTSLTAGSHMRSFLAAAPQVVIGGVLVCLTRIDSAP